MLNLGPGVQRVKNAIRQASVVQSADNSIQWINRYPADKMYFKQYILSSV